MYPNPAKDQLHITNTTPVLQVDIYNVEGERIHSEAPESEESVLNIGHLPAGIYIVRMTTGEQVFTRKFVKL